MDRDLEAGFSDEPDRRDRSAEAGLQNITIMALMGGHEVDPTVAVTIVGQSTNDGEH